MRAFGDTFIGTLVLGGLCAYGTWRTQHWIQTDLLVVPITLGLLTAAYALRLCLLNSTSYSILVDTPDKGTRRNGGVCHHTRYAPRRTLS